MTLEEAIAHLDESLNDPNRDWGCEECKNEHLQLRNWLQELKERRASNVKPVVQGEWIEKEVEVCRVKSYTGEDENGETHTIRVVEKGKEKEQRCPHCGAQADVFWKNYCPRCGAVMSGTEIKASATSVHTISLWLKKHRPSNWGLSEGGNR